MSRVSDFVSLPPGGLAIASTRSADRASAVLWFDSDSLAGVGTLISADLSLSSRGLSVAEHATQVLSHLCAESDERA